MRSVFLRRQGVPCHVREYDESGARSNLPMRLSREVERRMTESKSSDFQAIVRDVYHDATGPIRDAYSAILDAADSRYREMRAPAWLALRRARIELRTAENAYRIAKAGSDDLCRVAAKRELIEAKAAHADALAEHRQAVAYARNVRDLQLASARRRVYSVVVPALRWKMAAYRPIRSLRIAEV